MYSVDKTQNCRMLKQVVQKITSVEFKELIRYIFGFILICLAFHLHSISLRDRSPRDWRDLLVKPLKSKLV
jgi:hypothetical protein